MALRLKSKYAEAVIAVIAILEVIPSVGLFKSPHWSKSSSAKTDVEACDVCTTVNVPLVPLLEFLLTTYTLSLAADTTASVGSADVSTGKNALETNGYGPPFPSLPE